MFLLQVVPAHGEPFSHRLTGEVLVIGRSSQADLTLADRFLSRKHARLRLRDGAWFVEDLGSRNGTLLNGRRLRAPARLRPGDELRLSGSIISVREEGHTPSVLESAESSYSHTVLKRASDLVNSVTSPDTGKRASAHDLRRNADRLRLLNEVHRALNRSVELGELLELVLERALDELRPDEGVIFLKEPGGSFYEAARRAAPGAEHGYLHSETLKREVAEKGMAALVLDVEVDERFAGAKSLFGAGMRSVIAAPLSDATGSLGMIALNSSASHRRFDEDDLELLVAFASVAAMRIRNVALAEEAAERRRLEEELRLARDIQERLLPQRLPELPGYALHGGNVPSQGVSGDYYKVLVRDGGRECVLMMADVSGKGIGAALLTASLEALSAEPLESGRPPEEVCRAICSRLHDRTPSAKYATIFLAVLELESGTVRYANAGHNPALLVRAGGAIDQLGSTGPPIGLLPGASYRQAKVVMEPGDSLVVYTDGITEASNDGDEEYGVERLGAVAARCRSAAAAEMARAIERDVEEFAGGRPFGDDRTLVLVRRLAPGQEAET